MQVRVATVVFSITLLFIGLGCGLLLARIVATGPGPSDAALQQPDITPALASLERAVEQLSRDFANRPAAPEAPSPRELALPHASGTDRLTEAVEKLNALLSDRMLSSPTRGLPKFDWKGAGFASKELMGQRLEVLNASEGSDTGTELSHVHLGWTRDDVLERYGAPTSISTGQGGLATTYRFPMPKEQSATIFFLIADGLVISVYVS